MKKLITTTLIILAIGIAMIVVGSVLNGIAWNASFDGTSFASALNNVGYLAAALSGVVLTGVGIVSVIKLSGCDKSDKSDKDKDND